MGTAQAFLTEGLELQNLLPLEMKQSLSLNLYLENGKMHLLKTFPNNLVVNHVPCRALLEKLGRDHLLEHLEFVE